MQIKNILLLIVLCALFQLIINKNLARSEAKGPLQHKATADEDYDEQVKQYKDLKQQMDDGINDKCSDYSFSSLDNLAKEKKEVLFDMFTDADVANVLKKSVNSDYSGLYSDYRGQVWKKTWIWIVLLFVIVILWILFTIVVCIKSRAKQQRSANEKRIILWILVTFFVAILVLSLIVMIWGISDYSQANTDVQCISYNCGSNGYNNPSTDELDKSMKWPGIDSLNKDLDKVQQPLNDLSSSVDIDTIIGKKTSNDNMKKEAVALQTECEKIGTDYKAKQVDSPDPAKSSDKLDTWLLPELPKKMETIKTDLEQFVLHSKAYHILISKAEYLKSNNLVTKTDITELKTQVYKFVNRLNSKLLKIADAAQYNKSYFKYTTIFYLIFNALFVLCGIIGLYLVVFKKKSQFKFLLHGSWCCTCFCLIQLISFLLLLYLIGSAYSNIFCNINAIMLKNTEVQDVLMDQMNLGSVVKRDEFFSKCVDEKATDMTLFHTLKLTDHWQGVQDFKKAFDLYTATPEYKGKLQTRLEEVQTDVQAILNSYNTAISKSKNVADTTADALNLWSDNSQASSLQVEKGGVKCKYSKDFYAFSKTACPAGYTEFKSGDPANKDFGSPVCFIINKDLKTTYLATRYSASTFPSPDCGALTGYPKTSVPDMISYYVTQLVAYKDSADKIFTPLKSEVEDKLTRAKKLIKDANQQINDIKALKPNIDPWLLVFENYKTSMNCNYVGKMARKVEDEVCVQGSEAVDFVFKFVASIIALTFVFWLIILLAVFLYCPKTRKIVIYQNEMSQLQFSKKDEDNQDIQIINYNNQMAQMNPLSQSQLFGQDQNDENPISACWSSAQPQQKPHYSLPK